MSSAAQGDSYDDPHDMRDEWAHPCPTCGEHMLELRDGSKRFCLTCDADDVADLVQCNGCGMLTERATILTVPDVRGEVYMYCGGCR